MADRLLSASEDHPGFVYAMKCEGFVKIGWSKTVQRRYNQISANNPHKITLLGSAPGTVGDERLIQMLLWNPYRQKGEWFRYERLVVEVVENLIHSGDAEYTAEWLSKRLEDNRRPRADIKSHGKRPMKPRSPDAPEMDLTACADALADFGHNN
jgi:hypothetical protein